MLAVAGATMTACARPGRAPRSPPPPPPGPRREGGTGPPGRPPERDGGGLLVPGLDLGRGAAVQLARALGGQDDQQVAVRDLVEGLLQGWERHHSGTSTSGNLSVSRLVRQRSAWVIVASWSTASFTSRLMIR